MKEHGGFAGGYERKTKPATLIGMPAPWGMFGSESKGPISKQRKDHDTSL